MGKRRWHKRLRQLSLPVIEFYLERDPEPLFTEYIRMPIPRVGDTIIWWDTDDNDIDHECRAQVAHVEWTLWPAEACCERVAVQLEGVTVDGRPPGVPAPEPASE